MTNKLNPDYASQKTGILPFATGDLDRSGLRLTRAEFARFLGVSKQAVGEWVTAGKITLGVDGRLDPRQAVSQLLRNSDPARLRAKVLEPLFRDIGGLQKKVAALDIALASADENAAFHEECANELAAQQDAFNKHLHKERDMLARLAANKVIDGIMTWWNRVFEDGTETAGALSIEECVPGYSLDIPQHDLNSLPPGAPVVTPEGGADG
ncbi:MAG: hypothetical protein WC236_00075 [Gallionellaceae bacterium]|jgi:hypothetical protein